MAFIQWVRYIGHGATISAPHMVCHFVLCLVITSHSSILLQHAYAAEHLLPYLNPGSRVLDVGSGSGYLTAVFHHLVQSPTSKVVGIDHIKQLVDESERHLRKDGLGKALDDGEIVMITGDGRAGWAEGGECTLSSVLASMKLEITVCYLFFRSLRRYSCWRCSPYNS